MPRKKESVNVVLKKDKNRAIIFVLNGARTDNIKLNGSQLRYIFDIEGQYTESRDKPNKTAFIDPQGIHMIVRNNKTIPKRVENRNKDWEKFHKEGGGSVTIRDKTFEVPRQLHKVFNTYRERIKEHFDGKLPDGLDVKKDNFYHILDRLEEYELIKKEDNGLYSPYKVTQRSEKLFVRDHHTHRLESIGQDKIKRVNDRWTVYDFPDGSNREHSEILTNFKDNTEKLLEEFDRRYTTQLKELERNLILNVKKQYLKEIEDLEDKELKDYLRKGVTFNRVMVSLWSLLERGWVKGYSNTNQDKELDGDHPIKEFLKDFLKNLDTDLKRELVVLLELIHNPMFVYTPLSYEEESKIALRNKDLLEED